MTTETRAAFARRIGVNKSNITRAAQAGRIVLTAKGLVDVEASLERWHATKGNRPDVAARHAEQRGAEIPNPTQGGENATAGQIGATAAQPEVMEYPNNDGRSKWVEMRLYYENEMMKLKRDMATGRRYLITDAKRETHGLGATQRAAMERLIDQTAPRLAVMRDEGERRHLFDANRKQARFAVKTEAARGMRRLREAGGKKEGM